VVGLWPEVSRSRMADIASSAVASAARPQPDVVGIDMGVGAGVLSNVTEEESVYDPASILNQSLEARYSGLI
jgi:hypothetical protein